MAAEYTQTIDSLPAYAQIDGNSDVVFAVNWTLTGVDGAFSASNPMVTKVPYVAGDPFIPYADLTQDQVFAWIAQYTPAEIIASTEEVLQRSIDQQKAVNVLPLPWTPPPDPTPPGPTPPPYVP